MLFKLSRFRIQHSVAFLPLLGPLESLSFISDTNTDTNDPSCACAVLEKSMRASTLEAPRTEVDSIQEVAKYRYSNSGILKFFLFLHKQFHCLHCQKHVGAVNKLIIN